MSLRRRLTTHHLGRKQTRRSALLGAAALTLALGACVVDLGGLGGWDAAAHDINDCGVSVGAATPPGDTSYTSHAVRWSPGESAVDLNGSFEASVAVAVNDAGVAVGSATIDGQTHAVRWKPNGQARLLRLGAGSSAGDVADDGTIVGSRAGPSGLAEAFVRDGTTGRVTTLPAAFPGADHYASAVNERGDVVGYATPDRWAPVLWAAPDHQPVVLSQRAGLTMPTDINERGDVAGTWYAVRVFSTALVWRAGTHEEVELPVPEGITASVASAINDSGQVVGHTNMNHLSDNKAVRWTLDSGLPTRLGELGGGSSAANGLNGAGTAVGWSTVDETTPAGTPIRHAAQFPAPEAATSACGPP